MTMHFSRAFLLSSLVGGPLAVLAQTNNVAINNTGASPAPQAILDISSNTNDKGILIPRVPSAAALAAPVNGLTVYQTNAPKGFYHYSTLTGKWFRENRGGNTWEIEGSYVVNPAADFFGTTDDQAVAFRTSNIERMRFVGGTGYLGIGAPPLAPVEQLDVKGAMRLWSVNPVSGTAGSNALYSATSNPGVITYQKDNYNLSSTVSLDGSRPVLFKGHWGNIGTPAGTASPITVANATTDYTTGGWRRLENDYTEEFNRNYTQPGTVTCGAGSIEIPEGIAPGPSTLTTDPLISPYAHTGLRTRHQYMFRASELNAEAMQLNGIAATGGLCAGQPVNQIAFYVGAGVGRQWGQSSITLKHAAPGLSDLAGGFDNTVDPAQACANPSGPSYPVTIGGWDVFTLSPAFVWDGVSNVILEVVIMATAVTATNPPSVKYAPSQGGFIATAGKNGNTSPVNGCLLLGAAGSCGASVQGAGIVWSGNCPAPATAANLSTLRPVVRFSGTVASITTAVSGTGTYLRYNGAMIAESTQGPMSWGRWIANIPAGTASDSYRGRGTISAEKGIYDNGVRLNDHVFDRAFDGRVDRADAADFGDLRNLGIREMADFTRANHRLPTVRGRESWNREGGFALGDLTNQLWTTAETQALYVSTLHDRLNVLELLTNDRPLSKEESALARQAVCAMGDLTEHEKSALLVHLQERTVTTHTQR